MALDALLFRSALPEDAGPIADLVNSAYRGETSRQGWTTEADLLDGRRTDVAEITDLIGQPASRILLCLNGSRLLASVHIEQADDHAKLGLFVVKPGLQGRGVGKKLLEYAENVARMAWGSQAIALTVITLRHELISFYERRGFRRTGELLPFPVNPDLWTPKVAGLQLERLVKDLL